MSDQKMTAVRAANDPQHQQTGLAGRIDRWTVGRNHLATAIEGLSLHRWETPTEPVSYLMPPSLCLIGQGRKQLLLGDEHFEYDAHRFLITSVDLPVVTRVVDASPDKPYLGLAMALDLRLIAQLMLSSTTTSAPLSQDRIGVAVSEVPSLLLDAFSRLIDLLDHPQDIPALAPLIKQEIFYRLLVGEQGPRLRQITAEDSHSYQIAQAINWLRDHFDQPLRIEDLASRAGLSASAFHHHFRAMTAMSPLQFQKRIRLNEARRLMLTERLDASTAAFEVGYESPSQFSREYNRLFGAPPMRDIRNLMQASAT